MRQIKIHDKYFVPYISSRRIAAAVRRVAERLNRKYGEGEPAERPPVVVSVLNGAFMFTAELVQRFSFECEICFIKVSSYGEGMESKGRLCELIGLNCDIRGRDVILIDDIVDSGFTMNRLVEALWREQPRSVAVTAFIYKPQACKYPVKVDFAAITMSDSAFIVGHGLDYNQQGRALKDIYILDEQQ